MKLFTTILIFIFFSFSSFSGFAQNDSAIFLHHSTGGEVYSQGGVESWISDFNSGNGTNYYSKEFAYPNNPWSWSNYPYDYWKLWIDGDCNNAQSGITCLESFAEDYELIILKHCFPGAGIVEPDGEPDVKSSKKTFENYKLQYRALREKMDNMPSTKFMFWTLAPLHRLSTNSTQAQRANEFVEWVKNDFLTEDEKEHPNIYIFDFFGLVAELNTTPENGVQYCLKYNYEKSHSSDDSHPNSEANEYVGPFFARAIVNVLADTNQTTDLYPKLSTTDNPEICKGSEYDLSGLSVTDSNLTDATYTYHTATPALQENELATPVVNPTSTTTYYVLGTTKAGLTDEIPVEVKVNNYPDLSTTVNPQIKKGQSFELTGITINDANNTNASYTFHSDTPANANNKLSSTNVSPTETTNYYVLGNNSDCTDELMLTVSVQENSTKITGIRSKELLSVYPLPVKNTLQLRVAPNTTISSVEIISIDGKTVRNITKINENYQFDVRDLQNGMYILKVVINSKPTIKTFIKN